MSWIFDTSCRPGVNPWDWERGAPDTHDWPISPPDRRPQWRRPPPSKASQATRPPRRAPPAASAVNITGDVSAACAAEVILWRKRCEERDDIINQLKDALCQEYHFRQRSGELDDGMEWAGGCASVASAALHPMPLSEDERPWESWEEARCCGRDHEGNR